jgi:hypothetical protein
LFPFCSWYNILEADTPLSAPARYLAGK